VQDREFRLAAARAAGLKLNQSLIPDMITALVDADRGVADAAYQSLKDLTKVDFGRDADKWRQWWQEQSSRPPSKP
jgi:hypothetical protein